MKKESPSKYHKVRYTQQIESSIEFDELEIDLGYIGKISPGHGLLIADWREEDHLGLVRYLGIATAVNSLSGVIQLEWVECDITLKPNPSGRRYWRNTYLCFARDVVKRYMLDDLFAEHFPYYSDIPLDRRITKRTCSEKTYLERSGYVYVMKSEYGYKIGKAVNVENRTKQFGVKLPFRWEIVATKASDNYSKLEADLHRRFAEQRLEGEWFDLSDADLETISLWPT